MAARPHRPKAPRQRPRVAEEISVGGIVSGLRPLKTRKGDRMCVFMLDDAGGSIEVVVFPEAFKQCGHLAENGRWCWSKGKFERDDESARMLASEIAPIEIVRERLARSVAIRLSTPPHGRATFEKLWDVFAQHKGDRRVAFDIELQAPSAGCASRSTSTRRSASARRSGWCRRSKRSAAPAR